MIYCLLKVRNQDRLDSSHYNTDVVDRLQNDLSHAQTTIRELEKVSSRPFVFHTIVILPIADPVSYLLCTCVIMSYYLFVQSAQEKDLALEGVYAHVQELRNEVTQLSSHLQAPHTHSTLLKDMVGW